MKSISIKSAILVGSFGLALVAFQNCARTNFTPTAAAGVFKTEAIDASAPADAPLSSDVSQTAPPAPSTTEHQDAGDDGNVATTQPEATPAPESQPSVPPVTEEQANVPPQSVEVAEQEDKHPSQPQQQAPAESEELPLVECQLAHANQKIILDSSLKIGSNKATNRVCMSENACLKIINSFASERNCTISMGAGSQVASETQCTKIFPGSKGACKNATAVTDEEVESILSSMSH